MFIHYGVGGAVDERESWCQDEGVKWGGGEQVKRGGGVDLLHMCDTQLAINRYIVATINRKNLDAVHLEVCHATVAERAKSYEFFSVILTFLIP